jgi:hydrogenase expression/formation protein HypC
MCLGIPGKIISIYTSGTLKMAKVDFGGVVREACIETIPDLQIGEYTIIHAGFALNRMSENEARETLDALREMGELENTDL